ncbi:MAG: hypothetical protein AAF430_18085 [Myxococcota bacterium]
MSEDRALAALLLHGGIVFFIGMLVGVPYGVLRARGTPAEDLDDWRISHAQNLQNGFLLLFAGLCAPHLSLGTTATAWMVASLVVAAYTDMLAWLIRPLTGHSGLLPNPPLTNLTAFACFNVTIVGQFVGMAIFVWGAAAAWLASSAS